MAVPLETIVKQLEDTGIVAAGKLKECLPPKANPKSVDELVEELVKQNQLTRFQAHHVAAGKTRSLILGSYTILDKIGAGGMGQVFRAEHRRMKRVVAIKMLPPKVTQDAAATARFQREVEAAAKLLHSNIVSAFDADQANGAHFLVMEYVEGRDLSEHVKKNGRVPVHTAVNYILQAARGLEFAHAEGVVHRDIKPANLLLDKKGVIKILDMGLARIDVGGDVAAQSELTGTGTVMGTVDYMAPEQGMSTKHADARADIYSLGCSLHYLLIGKPVYEGETITAKLVAHHNHPTPNLCQLRDTVPEYVQAVFSKMVEKKLEKRYQSMSAVVADLERCQASLSAAASDSTSVLHAPATDKSSEMLPLAQQQTLTQIPPSNSSVFVGPLPKPGWKGPPWKDVRLRIGAGAAGFLFLLLGVWVIVRDKDGNEVARLKVPDGGTATVQSPAPPVQSLAPPKTALAPTLPLPAPTPAPPSDPLPAPKPTSQSTPAAVQNAIPKGPLVLSGGGGSEIPELKRPAAKKVPTPAIATAIVLAPPLAQAPFGAAQAKAHQAAWAKYLGTTVETTNRVGAKMVLIPPGEFLMGSTDEQVAAALREAATYGIDPRLTSLISTVERPQHRVVITRPFLISATELTIGQFKQFAAATSYQTEAEKAESAAKAVPPQTPEPGQPAPKPPPPIATYLNPGFAVTDDSPAIYLTWNDAVAYCNWLSEQERATYRLPTEAEWEYSCRAGTTTPFSFGNDYAELGNYAWYRMTSLGPTIAVASKLPNPFGLYDMHGNAWELCQDLWDERQYAKSTLNDPTGADSGTARVIRGGADYYKKVFCRSTHRVAATHNRSGFRSVRLLDVPASTVEPPVAQDPRLPIPDAAARLAAQQLLNSVFRAEMAPAKPQAEKAALAKTILQQADATADGPASKYVMLQEAQRLATDAADLVLVHRAIRSLATAYRVDAHETLAAALERIAQLPLLPAQQKLLAEAALAPVDELEANSRFEMAERFQAIALAAAQKAPDPAWIKVVVDRGESLADSKQQSVAAQEASAVLAEKPDDAAANLCLGKYLCFVVEQWQVGFAHLALGSDEKLAELAKLSLANPDPSAAAQSELGDAWLNAAEAADTASKPALQSGARHWYSRSVNELSGPAKVRVEDQLRSLPVGSTKPMKTVGALDFSRGDLVETAPVAKLPTVVCTCEAWLTPSAAASIHAILNGPYGRLSIQGDKFEFYTFNAAATSQPLYQPNRRIHLAGVNNGAQRRLYLDGALIASSNDAGTINPDPKEYPLQIGGDFAGRIEALRISQVARYDKDFIPPAQFAADADTVVLYRFEEGSGDVLRDSSGNNNHGTIKNATWVRTLRSTPLVPAPPAILSSIRSLMSTGK